MRYIGANPLEKLDPLSAEVRPANPHSGAGDVAPRSRETRHDARSNWIGDAREHDGDGLGRPFGGECAESRADHEHVDPQSERLSDQLGEALRPSLREPCLDDDILPLDVAQFPKPVPKCMECRAWRSWGDESDSVQSCRQLRLRS